MLNGQLLFLTPSPPGLAPAFCLRHDVDGLIWQPMGDELEQPWGCLHTAALQALGYIQASKEQRKFTVAPPSKLRYKVAKCIQLNICFSNSYRYDIRSSVRCIYSRSHIPPTKLLIDRRRHGLSTYRTESGQCRSSASSQCRQSRRMPRSFGYQHFLAHFDIISTFRCSY